METRGDSVENISEAEAPSHTDSPVRAGQEVSTAVSYNELVVRALSGANCSDDARWRVIIDRTQPAANTAQPFTAVCLENRDLVIFFQ